MPRTRSLSRAELVRATARIRSSETLADFFAAARATMVELFAPRSVCAYHFLDGRFNLVREGLHGAEGYYDDMLATIPQLRIADPRDLYRNGMVRHSSEVYRWYAERPEMIASAYLQGLHRWGVDWMLSASIFEDDVFLCAFGMGRTVEDGDFTAYDLEGFEALYPHLEATFKRCVRDERGRRLGAGVAAAVEMHPHPVFIFDGDVMRYANARARFRLQNERADGGRFPIAEGSQLLPKLQQAVASGYKTFQGVPLTVVRAPAWPDAGIAVPVLVMLAGRSPLPPAVSPREAAAVAAATKLGVARAAVKLGVTPSTLRTHLRNAYRKLGASNLSEAVVLLGLGRSA